MIELAKSASEELAHLEAATRRQMVLNGSRWLESEPWEVAPGVFVSCSLKVTNCKGHQSARRTWLLNWRPIGHNALMGTLRRLDGAT